MLIFFLIFIFAIVVFRMIYIKRVVKPLFVISLICLGLIIFNITCAIISKFETVGTVVIEKISNIPWDDDEYLRQMGFKEKDGLFVYDSFDGFGKGGHASFFCIYVEEINKEKAIKEYRLKNKNNILINFTKSNGYDNIFSEFLNRADRAGRFYSFYVKNRLIFVREHNEKGNGKLFEEYILKS